MVTIPPDGGTISGSVGLSTTVYFPAGNYSETLVVTLQEVEVPPSTGGFRLLGAAFSVEATIENGDPVTQFDQDLTIVIDYGSTDLAGVDETSLVLYFWDVADQRWVALPTTVDTAAKTLTVQVDHLTTFAVLKTAAVRVYLPAIMR